MDTYEYGKLLQSLNVKKSNIEKIINPDKLGQEIKDMKIEQQVPNF